MTFPAKADALLAAWERVTGQPPPCRSAVLLCLAQAQLETRCGDAWPGCHNWGATDYRSLRLGELTDYQGGTLVAGHWLHADGSHGADRRPGDVAQMHLDTHPGGGSYPMWFAAFDDDTSGAAYYLRIVLRMAGEVLASPLATSSDLATAVYLHGYYEGVHPGARPYTARTLPLTAPELANVADYARGLDRCRASIEPALTDWTGVVDVPPTDPMPAAGS